ncbi:hypothetical protein E4T66_16370 [Sinimarinibacterium sp. CAU 1509]|uniref:hypothetical protein n=1 Tax=Sinimarinibacterium sp. CAU 1509 TaxID=2562283 RepID=UPI0010AB5C5C|nr:hypothetical protein [Sinimarinibacterium sp. CAU 1509]TJY58269.1 hypothetical protein E4T66_16370 [Sinimarinibacterium sp. CAU 1509]
MLAALTAAHAATADAEGIPPAATADASIAQAEALVALVRQQQPNGDYRVRMLVETSTAATPLGLLIKGSRTSTLHRFDVLATAPSELRGQRLRVVASGGEPLIITAQHDKSAEQALAATALEAPLFDTDLELADFLGPQWLWPVTGLLGSQTLLQHECQIVQLSEATPGTRRLRACVAADIGLPLLSEQLDANGGVIRRYRALALTRIGQRWAVRVFDVEHPQRGSVSRVQLIGAEFDMP